jgi:hypothetical protein
MPSSYGVAFRDQAALERVLGNVAKRPRRAKQLTLGETVARRPRGCIACGRLFPKSGTCPGCNAFVCRGCDELTTCNGGVDGHCLECLLVGRDADPRTLELEPLEAVAAE